MKLSISRLFKKIGLSFYQQKFVILILFIGTELIIQSLFFNLSRLPGDLGDARFNNYILEHFYQWITHPGTNFWDAPFFYPYPLTTAFSDSLLGSAPFYAIFRFLSFSRETAFQGWYVIGYILNYLAAVFVLLKLELKPIAAAGAAFIFAFGLPVLAQENHAQLIYRFCVPLAAFFLWDFAHHPRWRTFLLLNLTTVYQFLLTFYIGYFLVMLLLVMMLLIPFFARLTSKNGVLTFWPTVLKTAWAESDLKERFLAFLGIIAFTMSGFIGSIYPYFRVAQLYKFSRSEAEIASMLPRLQSYFLADNSQIWHSNASIFSALPLRHEHQLFPGMAILVLILVGILWNFPAKKRSYALLNLFSAFILISFTVSINEFSIYKLIIHFPGINSIRAITRIQLVLMWPLAVFSGSVLSAFLEKGKARRRYTILACIFLFLLVIESAFYDHSSFSKKEAQLRIQILREQVQKATDDTNTDPILFVGTNVEEPWFVTELDAMLVAQEMGIPTLNGYSGNLLYGFGEHTECAEVPNRIVQYIRFSRIFNENEYYDLINRVIPLRLNNCNPHWLTQLPIPIQP